MSTNRIDDNEKVGTEFPSTFKLSRYGWSDLTAPYPLAFRLFGYGISELAKS